MNGRRFTALAVISAALFVPLFGLRRLGPLDFWAWMSATAAAVTLIALTLDPGLAVELRRGVKGITARAVAVGALSALALYAFFALGAFGMRRLWPASGTNIENVYAFKEGVSPARIVLLLALVIGPAEELFWRASLQRLGMERWGALRGTLAASAVYSAAHAASGNPLLIAAAGICGLFWGAMYARWRSLAANVVSHVVWDVLIFVVAPV